MFVFRRDARPGMPGVAFTSAGLDLGDRQPPDARAAAFATLSAELGVPVAVARQVHGREVLVVESAPRVADDAADVGTRALRDLTGTDADALVTTTPRVGVAVRVADCLPILLADAAGTVVAAVHAGRAGLLDGVVDAAVDAVTERADGPVEAWIGPHICAHCYEVPPALAADAASRLGTDVPTTRWGTPGIDLTAAAVRQLQARGVRVTQVGGCTLEDERLYSHRRTPDAGRLVGVAWLA